MSSAHQIGDLANNVIEGELDGKRVIVLNTKAFTIIWGGKKSNGRYWRHITDTYEGTAVEVVELLGVCWLEIRGKIDLKQLSPGTAYKFYATIRLTPEASGWKNSLVKFTLQLTGKTPKSASVDLTEYMDSSWVDVPVSGLDFQVPQDNSSGKLSFAMYEIEGGEWKKGLVVKDVTFVPQAQAPSGDDVRVII